MEKIFFNKLSTCCNEMGWKNVGIYPHHGIVVHLSSLHSKNSCGVGEFFDLIPLIKWSKEVGFDIIQLLPINDSGLDSSPYNACSSCALNPIYLSLASLDYVDQSGSLLARIKDLQKYNYEERVPYEKIQKLKNEFLEEYFHQYFDKILQKARYQKFITSHPWLESYALFKSLKNYFGESDFFSWPTELRMPTEDQYQDLLSQHKERIHFYSFVQFLCYEQLVRVKQIANESKIFIKGDIPILISPDSSDVWYNSDLFVLDFRAGAPPDKYNPDGQNWGFPLYNWSMIRKQNFLWWKHRMEFASHFFDLYRLDHVLGFFRIWAVLKDCDPKLGKFSPSDEELWEGHGREILSKITSFTSMLPIAEDLGTVPECTRPVLDELGICGTKVVRWERNWENDEHFTPLEDYPLLSMTTTSTHDSPTLAQWWRDFPEEVLGLCELKGWDYDPILTTEQRLDLLKDSHKTSSIFHINLLQEYISLCPELSWENIDQDRINIPGKILSTNWTYKFKVDLEKITENSSLKNFIKEILN